MSDTNAPQVPDFKSSEDRVLPPESDYPQGVASGLAAGVAPVEPVGPVAPMGPVAPQIAPAVAEKGLPIFLKVSIVLLIGLTVASISLLFLGDFQGRFERVFSTFALFATFVVLTAIDTSRDRKNDWYAPVALVANTYILGLLLIVIWMTPYNSFSLLFDIVWKSLFVVVVIRLVIICCELLLRSGQKSGELAERFAFITSMLAILSGILFTVPTGIEAFNLYVPDLYWKISTAVLILTALGLSVTLLLRWAGRSDEREVRRQEARRAEVASQETAAQAAAVQATAAQATATQATVAQGAESAPAPGELLPWPLFANGQPFPAGPDGQPDFEAAGVQRPQY